jgi:hypothetical protein
MPRQDSSTGGFATLAAGLLVALCLGGVQLHAEDAPPEDAPPKPAKRLSKDPPGMKRLTPE